MCPSSDPQCTWEEKVLPSFPCAHSTLLARTVGGSDTSNFSAFALCVSLYAAINMLSAYTCTCVHYALLQNSTPHTLSEGVRQAVANC